MSAAAVGKSPGWRTPLVVIIAGCLISLLGFGIRSSFGLFLEPMTVARGWTRETFGLAMALQNLFWGLGLPIAGAMADKFGSVRVIVFGAIVYALGVYGMSLAETGTALALTGGVLAGTGIAFSAFTLAMAAMARVVSPDRRSLVRPGHGGGFGGAGVTVAGEPGFYYALRLAICVGFVGDDVVDTDSTGVCVTD